MIMVPVFLGLLYPGFTGKHLCIFSTPASLFQILANRGEEMTGISFLIKIQLWLH